MFGLLRADYDEKQPESVASWKTAVGRSRQLLKNVGGTPSIRLDSGPGGIEIKGSCGTRGAPRQLNFLILIVL